MVKLIWFVNFRNNIYTFNFLYKNLIFNFQGNLNSSSNFIPYKYILNSQSESSAHASRISIHNKGKKITQWKNPINEIMDMKGITFQALHWIASNLFFFVFYLWSSIVLLKRLGILKWGRRKVFLDRVLYSVCHGWPAPPRLWDILRQIYSSLQNEKCEENIARILNAVQVLVSQ